MGKHYNHLTETDRINIEKLYAKKYTPKEIAISIGCSLATVYNEIKRGRCIFTDINSKKHRSYSAEIAQTKHNNNLQSKGRKLKIDKDHELRDYIENKIINEKYSPEAVVEKLRTDDNVFKSNICTRTLYNYIDKGIFPNLNIKSKSKNKGK